MGGRRPRMRGAARPRDPHASRRPRARAHEPEEPIERIGGAPRRPRRCVRLHGARQAEERLVAGEHWRDERNVLTTPLGDPIDARNLLRSRHALRERAGLPAMTVHDLRQTTATLLRNLGVPMDVVSRILRHSRISITADIYHYDEVGYDLAGERVEVLGRAHRQADSAT